ncbi:TonB-dependent receptor [Aquimarina sp. AU58]|uniref:SusC/RagA family TonB-linked outer membrane protein n=1 Tax=Aquimarina sp. AU58 TaxID=1874112 RepID=UPI000D6E918B|nr:TonB-dependent receptor [Aquimarina sp. AU58]
MNKKIVNVFLDLTKNKNSIVSIMRAFVLLLCIGSTNTYGNIFQEREITGMVSDQNNLPLPGATVNIKNTTIGTQTDFDGNYTIKASTGQVLVFNYIGMASIEMTVGSSNIINVSMQEDAEGLDEIVIVAYGRQTKKSIVGSVVVVGEEIIKKQQATNITTSIQGSVPGVNLISQGGQPGANPIIRIRGVGTLDPDNENGRSGPLIIVDGAPYNGNINVFSADQIESINVLKDASSTALYGSRAANGVVVITTKRGNINSAPKVTLRSTTGFANQAVKPHEIMNVDEQFKHSWEAIRNSRLYVEGEDAATAATYATNNLVEGFLTYNPYGGGTPEPVDINGNLVTSNKLWETDWRDLFQNNSAIRTDHSLSVSGGSKDTKYFLSANYLNQEGSVATSKFERITTRLNVDSNINKWLSAGLGITYSTSESNTPLQSGAFNSGATFWMWNASPVYPLYQRDADGQIMLDGLGNKIFDYGGRASQSVNGQRPFSPGQNAYAQLFNDIREENRDNITLNGNLKVNITPDLNFKTQLSHTHYVFDSFRYGNSEFGENASVDGFITQQRNVEITTNLTNSLNFKKSFNAHNINATLIQEAYKYKFKPLSATAQGFLPNVIALSAGTTPTGATGFTEKTHITSYMGRLAYNYDNKYYLEGSYRKDGTSRFASDVRWGDFYSVGGSWVVSDENFLADNSTLNYLKLKASYGELGNSDGLATFPYQTLFLSDYSEGDQPGVLLAFPNDPRITWEKTALLNTGIDFGLFNNTISGTVEYYNRKSIDLFYDVPTPASTGATSFTTNAGSLKNYGLEITLDTKIISKANFEWTTNFNITFENNEILELTQESFINGTKRWEVGKSMYEFYLREYAGVDAQTGEALWYKDILDTEGNPTGERETTNVFSDATRYDTGKESLPDFYGGFRNYVRVGDFDMSILFNYSYGGYLYDSQYAALMGSIETAGRAISVDLADRWQKPGDITDVPRLLASNNDYNSQSDRFLFKNNYVRLKALNLGYNFPSDLMSKFSLSSMRVFFQGDNLFTFQSHKGIDPEQNIAGSTNQRAFNQRIYSFGVNLEF